MKFITAISYHLCSIFSLLALVACAPSLSPDFYTSRDAGQIRPIVKGTIVKSHRVWVSDNNNEVGIGGLTGGALGAIAGSEIGQGRGSLAAGIGGALLGGLAGNQVQQGLNRQTAVEYVIQLHNKNKSLISVVQGPTPTFHRGQHVLVQYGGRGRSRIIADSDYDTN